MRVVLHSGSVVGVPPDSCAIAGGPHRQLPTLFLYGAVNSVLGAQKLPPCLRARKSDVFGQVVPRLRRSWWAAVSVPERGIAPAPQGSWVEGGGVVLVGVQSGPYVTASVGTCVLRSRRGDATVRSAWHRV